MVMKFFLGYMHMARRKITLEGLAVMVKRGFDDISGRMATKEDLKGFATKEDFKLLAVEIDRIHADIRDIKITLGPLARIAGAHEREILELRFRVAKLEKKVGLSK